jgi:hypothetical protein
VGKVLWVRVYRSGAVNETACPAEDGFKEEDKCVVVAVNSARTSSSSGCDIAAE